MILQLQPTKTNLTVLILVTVAASVSGAGQEVLAHTRNKRHLLQLCDLIFKHTGRSCMAYNNYGCFCGLGNSGGRPVDGVDNCCRIHDGCYGQTSCMLLYPQFVGYSVQCDSTGCKCTDSSTRYPCAYKTCQCDLSLAKCLGNHQMNRAYMWYKRRNCRKNSKRNRRNDKKQEGGASSENKTKEEADSDC